MNQNLNIKILTDQLGVQHEFSTVPFRVVSLVPSLSELLYDLGLAESIAGVTKFCVHPATLRKSAVVIGGTKMVHEKRIASLKPNLIIANKEENTMDIVESLRAFCPVWCTDICDIDGLKRTIMDLGEIFNNQEKALEINTQLDQALQSFEIMPPERSVAYLIWKDPFMAAGGGTYINSMLNLNGLRNIFSEVKRYPEVTIESLKELKPDMILLSSEPYPFRQKHLDELKEECPESKIMLVDGEMFSWYGSRLLNAIDYFKQLQNNFK